MFACSKLEGFAGVRGWSNWA